MLVEVRKPYDFKECFMYTFELELMNMFFSE